MQCRSPTPTPHLTPHLLLPPSPLTPYFSTLNMPAHHCPPPLTPTPYWPPHPILLRTEHARPLTPYFSALNMPTPSPYPSPFTAPLTPTPQPLLAPSPLTGPLTPYFSTLNMPAHHSRIAGSRKSTHEEEPGQHQPSYMDVPSDFFT